MKKAGASLCSAARVCLWWLTHDVYLPSSLQCISTLSLLIAFQQGKGAFLNVEERKWKYREEAWWRPMINVYWVKISHIPRPALFTNLHMVKGTIPAMSREEGFYSPRRSPVLGLELTFSFLSFQHRLEPRAPPRGPNFQSTIWLSTYYVLGPLWAPASRWCILRIEGADG